MILLCFVCTGMPGLHHHVSSFHRHWCRPEIPVPERLKQKVTSSRLAWDTRQAVLQTIKKLSYSPGRASHTLRQTAETNRQSATTADTGALLSLQGKATSSLPRSHGLKGCALNGYMTCTISSLPCVIYLFFSVFVFHWSSELLFIIMVLTL